MMLSLTLRDSQVSGKIIGEKLRGAAAWGGVDGETAVDLQFDHC